MAAAKRTESAPSGKAAAQRLLPLPEMSLQHHAATLDRPMTQWRETRRVPPVLLLIGPSGIGKRALCHYLAQWFLCENNGIQEAPTLGLFGGDSQASDSPVSENPRPCGACPACQRALSGNWVDFTEISSDTDGEETGTGTLKIEQFRRLKETMGFGSFEGSFRLTLIRDADRMTPQAANSLLKLLEEPPPGWIFLLTASDTSSLLPTLVSRCQVLRVRPYSVATLEAMLSELDPPLSEEKRRTVAELAQGSWGRALALAEGEAWERRQELMRFLEEPENQLAAWVDWAATEPSHFQLFLDQLEQVLAELNRWSASSRSPEFRWSHRALESYSASEIRRQGGEDAAARFWIERATRVFAARGESLAPLNKKLLAQELLLPFCGK